MSTINVGDTVAVLDEPITGKVLSKTNEEITITTEDGFDLTFFTHEVV